MGSGCEVLFGVIGLIFMRFVVESLPSPAVEQVDRQASQLERGKKRGKVVDDMSTAWGCEELFGVIGVIWVRFLSGLATVASCEDVVESEKMYKKAS